MIDKIYVLHHKDFTKRKEFIENRLKEEDIEFEFVENFLPEEIDYEKELENWENFPKIDVMHPYGVYANFSKKISAGSLSLVLKHLWCFKEQIKHNYENILILEDDANIPPSFKNLLYKIMVEFKESDSEMVMVGTSHHFQSKNITPGRIVHDGPNQKTRCTHAYIINISITQKLIDGFNIINLPIDFKLNEIIQLEDIKVAWVEPGITQKIF